MDIVKIQKIGKRVAIRARIDSKYASVVKMRRFVLMLMTLPPWVAVWVFVRRNEGKS